MARLASLLLMIIPGLVLADEIPREGPARLAAIRKQLSGTVSKFEFTQGYGKGRSAALIPC